MSYPPISTPGPCACCSAAPELTLFESQTWINTLGPYLCGQIGYDGVDLDTFYRNESASGSFHVIQYAGACEPENIIEESDETFGGSCVADPGGACDLFGNDPPGLTRNGDPAGCNGSAIIGHGPEADAGAPTTTATSHSLTGTGDCITGLGTGGAFSKEITGSASSTLSSPDSEADAIDRDNPGGDYSSWADTGMSPVYADYLPPTGGSRYFTYYKAKFRATVSGLSSGQTVGVSIDVFRDSVLFATLTGSVTESGGGSGTWEDEVPIARGYSTYVDPTTFVVTP
jgi:hypothetical protein